MTAAGRVAYTGGVHLAPSALCRVRMPPIRSWFATNAAALLALAIPAAVAAVAWAGDSYLDAREGAVITRVEAYVEEQQEQGLGAVLEAIGRVEDSTEALQERTDAVAVGLAGLRAEVAASYLSKEDAARLRERVDRLFEMLSLVP